MKAKNALAGVAEDIKVKKNVNPVIINQEAVKRLINHVLK